MTTIAAKFQQAINTSTNWATNTTVLYTGELAYASDLNILKIGDNVSMWSEASDLDLKSSIFSGILDLTVTEPPVEGSILVYHGSTYGWVLGKQITDFVSGQYVFSLNYMDDVNYVSPSDGQILHWDESALQWINVDTEAVKIDTTAAPTLASDPGEVGEIRYDSSYMYVCIATNTWKRAAMASW